MDQTVVGSSTLDQTPHRARSNAKPAMYSRATDDARCRNHAQIETEAWLALAESVNDGGPVTHSIRVGALAARLGLEIGLSAIDIVALDLGARLHDIGKVFISESILLSPDKLDDESRALMQTHTVKGAELLSRAKCDAVKAAAQVARHHHERWDGSGYPDQLSGEDIPLVARITALADVYDALRSERSYKSAWSHADAVREIQSGKGSHFDPELADIFLQMLEREISGTTGSARGPLYLTDDDSTGDEQLPMCSSSPAANTYQKMRGRQLTARPQQRITFSPPLSADRA
jgi:putative nucleotidyltransferase with HDIG domain